MKKCGSMVAAIYARVSSEQQAEAATIDSQVTALLERIVTDGLTLESERRFLDEGYSGATLIRPALERLRDVAAAGAIDRLYVHSPDRLARKYAYQVLLLDELQRCGVEVIFLNHPLGKTPEEDLLLQVQGMVAEYERAKILERSRRGKLHAARQGSVNVLSGAPYGYRYVSCREGDGEARYEIVLEEARLIRQIFEWVGRDGLSIGEVCRRLKKQGIPSPRGKSYWDRTTVWGHLKNSAYRGNAIFGKTRIGPKRPCLRAQRGRLEQPRRSHSIYDMPEDHRNGCLPIRWRADLPQQTGAHRFAGRSGMDRRVFTIEKSRADRTRVSASFEARARDNGWRRASLSKDSESQTRHRAIGRCLRGRALGKERLRASHSSLA